MWNLLLTAGLLATVLTATSPAVILIAGAAVLVNACYQVVQFVEVVRETNRKVAKLNGR